MTKLTFLENDDYRLVAAEDLETGEVRYITDDMDTDMIDADLMSYLESVEDWLLWHILEASGVWELYNMNNILVTREIK